jgi:hypothetical protein
MRDLALGEPICQLEPIGGHGAERADLLVRQPTSRRDHAGNDGLLVDVESAAALVASIGIPRSGGRAGYPVFTEFAVRASHVGATLSGASGHPGHIKELCETAGMNWCSKLQAGVVKEGDAQLGVATDPVQTILRNVGDFIDGGGAEVC